MKLASPIVSKTTRWCLILSLGGILFGIMLFLQIGCFLGKLSSSRKPFCNPAFRLHFGLKSKNSRTWNPGQEFQMIELRENLLQRFVHRKNHRRELPKLPHFSAQKTLFGQCYNHQKPSVPKWTAPNARIANRLMRPEEGLFTKSQEQSIKMASALMVRLIAFMRMPSKGLEIWRASHWHRT